MVGKNADIFNVQKLFHVFVIGTFFHSLNALMTFWYDMDEIFKKGILRLQNWERICFSSNFETNLYRIWSNDEFHTVTGTIKIDRIRGNGYLFLGQDQDSHGGDFSADQSLSAVIADFFLFDYEIPASKAKQFVQCKDILDDASKPPIVNFRNIENDWILNGSTVMGSYSSEEICSLNRKVFVFYPEIQLFSMTKYLCHITGGRL